MTSINNRQEDFEIIYNKYFKYSYKIANGFLPTSQDVEDVVSEVFLVVWKNLNSLKADNIKPYIFRITKNKINDVLRKKYQIKFEFNEQILSEVSSEDGDKQNSLNNEKLIQILDDLSNSLKTKEKELYQLKYKQRLSNSEIAQKLNISVNYVKVINNRTTKSLKKLWTQNYKNFKIS